MLIGTDPEFFILDTKTKEVKSASEVFPDKKDPWMPVRSTRLPMKWFSYLGTNIFRDGFGVEINVPPSACRETLTCYVMEALRDVKTKVRDFNPDWDVISDPTVGISMEYLEKLPDDVKQFGCDPSWNAWTESEERIELNGAAHLLRYAGGHMHFGSSERSNVIYPNWTNSEARKRVFQLIRLFDLTIGLPLSLIFNHEDEFLRRKYYGRAGEFRFQPHGVEYRVPSPRIWNHSAIASLVFGVGKNIIYEFNTWVKKWETLSKSRPNFEDDLILAINEGKGGEELIQEVTYFYNKSVIDFLKGKGRELFKLNELTLHKLDEGRRGFYNEMLRAKKFDLIPQWHRLSPYDEYARVGASMMENPREA